jgi:peptide/nickel transport system ATP-binding protein
MLLGLIAPDPGGRLTLDGRSVPPVLRARTRADRKALQIVFQNPDSALNRAQTVRMILSRPMRRLAHLRGADLAVRLRSLADSVRLSGPQMAQMPRTLSGGQKQRVAIARAIAGNPRVVICDEPTSALDVSVQAAILNLLADQQCEAGMSYIFISHDLNVIRYMSDRVAVLYRGLIVETGPAEAVFAGPNHPYTATLLQAAMQNPEAPAASGSMRKAGAGCVFTQSCRRYLGAICDNAPPVLPACEHAIRCHIPLAEL